MKAGVLPVSLDLLASLLGLPNTDTIAHADFKFDTRAVNLYLHGDKVSTLPEIKEGDTYPVVMAEVHKDEQGNVKFNKYNVGGV